MDVKFPPDVDITISKPDISEDEDFIIDYEIKQSNDEINKLKDEIKLLEVNIAEPEKLSEEKDQIELEKIVDDVVEELKPKKKYEDVICYYINLDRRKDRIEKLKPALEFLEPYFKCERFSAVDGKTIDYQKHIRIKTLPKLKKIRIIKNHLLDINLVLPIWIHCSNWVRFI